MNTTQQTGGTLGAALINTIATSATVSYVAAHGKSVASLTAGSIHGYTTAFTFSAIVLAVAAVSAFTLIQRGRPERGRQRSWPKTRRWFWQRRSDQAPTRPGVVPTRPRRLGWATR